MITFFTQIFIHTHIQHIHYNQYEIKQFIY